MKAEILGRHPMFAVLPVSELDVLAEGMEERVVQAGEILFKEGESSQHFYVLLEGQVEILKSLGSSDERLVAVREQGALLGEMSMFNADGSHTASVRARTALKVLAMTRRRFDNLLRRRPELAYHLVGMLARRLQESENTTILELRDKNQALMLAYQELKGAQAQIIEKEKLERELEIASKLQLSILPQAAPQHAGYDFGARMVPARMVGGDFYDFIPLGSERLGIVVGDVCDKGIPAALFMTLTYSAMRSEAVRHRKPGPALQAVNRRLVEINPAGMFVTLLYGILDLPSRRFSYARAGHPHPMLLDGHLIPAKIVSQPGQPVGLFEDLLLDEQSLSIPPGGTLLMYSDGLSEALEYQQGMPGVDGLCRRLLEGGEKTAQGLCDGLWNAMANAPGDTAWEDDFTVLAVRTA